MRSSLLRPRSLVTKRAPCAQRVLFSYSQTARYPRRQPTQKTTTSPSPSNTSRTPKRSSSSSLPAGTPSYPPSLPAKPDGEPSGAVASAGSPPSPPEEPEENPEDEGEQEKPLGEPEKAKRTRRTKAEILESAATSDNSVPLPPELNILWTPDTMEATSPSALPPPEIFQEVLTDLLITLHPQTQHRGAYASSSSAGSPVEPTLGLYCPFEGGDYIIDETVRELARRTDSDVIVLDAVQLAAGQAGCFGKAASVLQLPQNPLHFRAPVPQPSPIPSSKRRATEDEYDDDEEGDYGGAFIPSHMTFHVLSPGGMRPSRQSVSTSSTSRGSSGAKTKAFFDELINTPSPKDAEALSQGKRRSRLIYIRDYPTLAASAATWYPSLLAAVRQRRQGPISRPTSPVTNTMTIVFGMTPPIVQPSFPSHFGGPGLLGLFNSRQSSPTVVNPPSRPGRSDYGEGEYAEKARERRLRERLRRWERDEPGFYDEMPRLPHSNDGVHGGNDRTGFVMVGPPLSGISNAPPGPLLSALQNRGPSPHGDSEDNSAFFRTSVLVPSVRNHGMERSCRTARRREINELTMRMAVDSIGGRLEGRFSLPEPLPSGEGGVEASGKSSSSENELHDAARMWEEWGKHVEAWTNVKDIADRAVGTVVANNISTAKLSLDSTPVPWPAVVSAWSIRSSIREIRKTWLQESGGKTVRYSVGEEEEEEEAPPTHDEVIQRVKEESDLTPHEQRLLGCIVDAASMPTSFDQVHLPAHTIDSVRTIVSLPLLHPTAFQSGILKQHSMTGCLLFGPPGTGKTLVVRALARDAGCRMLAVQPSDVMDMYVGEGEKLVRSLFSLARRLSPCVIFLDEIDALFGARSSARETGGALAHHGVITEFMQEMDGLKTKTGNGNVIVIGATNRPFDLDDAVLRRLPRRLLVDLPGVGEREEILKILLRDEELAPDVDLAWLAKRTEMFSGSDLKHLCVSAALDAVKEGITLPWAVPSSTSGTAESATTEATSTTTAESSSTTANEDKSSTTTAEALTRVEDTSSEAGESSTSQQCPSSPSPTSSETTSTSSQTTSTPDSTPQLTNPRTLYLRHFTKALKEISPSSSESLGSLAALRKWNEEFGEGMSQKKRARRMWGRGSFGFADPEGKEVLPDGRVSVSAPP
ncbi:AAA-domain-containing protein [Fomitiporia mediterranea MF3/22]|uniref:AAA-domain-containing protein n=1 Tax=Fomitiporia mediterranea (strain MF3/22) TaxID=694068 RepID=UPI000440870F|nr:AAA-domain-containing protein [Fomitiporia mediterranea MF3/22]EJD05810.1 AAA-domain-containing protein [Fomitiporia mediterranea MF3/22]